MKTWIVLMAIFFCLNAYSKAIQVGGKIGISSIKLAIKLSSDGDTILVYPGLYREGNIVINKSDLA